ncbi:galacturonokinase [Thalictrum thalictroides]|uniref:Galacturonokinase n=1 Tax=Thalictrum thalictroides TaxID=46969 RepID=A0A7J6V293_THATH|nr:galacturonokinase [Thalictrum thalictroides]
MGTSSWPSEAELNKVKKVVSELSGRDTDEVRVVVSPYRICPLGAHIDHQGGNVSAMTINKGILLGFVASGDPRAVIRSGQFQGEVRFRVDEVQRSKHATPAKVFPNDSSEECNWGSYGRGALYALQRTGKLLTQGIIGFICGSEGLDSSGLSSSAAAGVAYLLALETANNLSVSPTDNIELDR